MKMEVDEWVGRHWNLTYPLRASPSTARVWHFRILWQTRTSQAEVAKLADAPDLGSGGAILRGSSPLLGKHLLWRTSFLASLRQRQICYN
jgi:hypothetical protein